ncbi:hypothetical protein Fmac_001087 [Flemingia macrophylla]|uniref:Uncharacterized protein n=1 Tax=Flemingia macrophylla TaxID=520843 RepID=A0ABD1NHC7_9FABA
MGGNNSRLHGNNEGEVMIMPEKIQSLLRRRVEEFRGRRTLRKEQEQEASFLKKQLFNWDVGSEGSTNAKREENLSRVVPLPFEKSEVVDDEEEIEDNEDDEVESGRLIGPGSPSFRIYIQPENNNKRQGELSRSNALVHVKRCLALPSAGDENHILVFRKSPSADSIESSASDDSNEMLQTVGMKLDSRRKGYKKQKLEALKKNIFHVRNLHNRMRTRCHTNERTILKDR